MNTAKHLLHALSCALFVGTVASLCSCTTENYKEGDDKYSYITSDLGTIDTDKDCLLHVFRTDDGRELPLATPLEKKWAATPDSTYRVLVRYQANETTIKPFTLDQIFTMTFSHELPNKVYEFDDPLTWDSSWLSTDGKYINLGVTLMMGTDNGEEIGAQKIRARYLRVEDVVNDPTRKHHYLRIHHDQCDVPQYYSYPTFLSIPTQGFAPNDSVTIIVNTPEGIRSNSFLMK